jgi:hypothetical protein
MVMKRTSSIASAGTESASSSALVLWQELLAWAGEGVRFRMSDACAMARQQLKMGRNAFRNAIVELEHAGLVTVEHLKGGRNPQPGTVAHRTPQISTSIQLDPERAINSFRRPLGAHSAVYRIFNTEGELLYVGCTRSMPQRWRGHARTQPWWHEVALWTNQWFATRRQALDEENRAIAVESPRYNIVGREVGR